MDQLWVQWSHHRNTIHLLIKCTLPTPLPPASIQIPVCENSRFAYRIKTKETAHSAQWLLGRLISHSDFYVLIVILALDS